MADSDLTDIDGVGPSTVETLNEHGIETVKEVTLVDVYDLDDIVNVPGVSAEEVQERAATLLEDDVDENSSEDVDGEIEDLHEISITADGLIWVHTLNAVMSEAVRMRQRNDHDAEADLYRIITQIINDLSETKTPLDQAGEITVKFDATVREADIIHQAVSAGVSNYRALSGITSLWGDMQQVVDQLNDVRMRIR